MDTISNQQVIIFLGVVVVLFIIAFVLLLIVSSRSQKGKQDKKDEQVDSTKISPKYRYTERDDKAKPWQNINRDIKASQHSELEISAEVPPRYKITRYFFSYQERIFYQLLSQAVDEKYAIFAQVRMAACHILGKRANEQKNLQ